MEVLLFIALLIGAVLVSQSIWKKAELTREHDRLMQKTGDLVITDPTKVHMRALDTGEPLHFAWRAYFPANYNFGYTSRGGSGWGTQSEPWEGILRVRMREVDGNMQLYYRFIGGSGLRSMGSGGLKELQKKHPDLLNQLQVEQLASDGPITFPPEETQTLIKITLPEYLIPDDKKKRKSWEYQQLVPALEWIRIGPHEVLEKEAKERGEQ
jgi:hypothetical protein